MMGNLLEDQQTFLIISRSVLLRIRNFQRKFLHKSKRTFYVQQPVSEICAVFMIMWKNTAQPNTSQVTTKYGACALHVITKPIDTHSEYITQCLLPFPRQRY
jgi:hypothetical protein